MNRAVISVAPRTSISPASCSNSSLPWRKVCKFMSLHARTSFVVSSFDSAGEINLQQKGYLKDLIVDQDKNILGVAEAFDATNDLEDFKDSLQVRDSDCCRCC